MLDSCNSIFDNGISKINTIIYVTKAGNDFTGNGSFEFPFLTIQKGLNEAYNLYVLPNEPQFPQNYIRPAVWVGEGVYIENLILPPQIQIWGTGYNFTQIVGNITIDNKWSNYIPNPLPPPPLQILQQSDLRTSLIQFQVTGDINIDFDFFESNQGKITLSHCKIVGFTTLSQKLTGVVGNSFTAISSFFTKDIILNGIPTLLRDCEMIQAIGLGAVRLNQVISETADNYFQTCGGSLQDVIVDSQLSETRPYFLIFGHQLKPNASLTINGKYAEVKSEVYSIPEITNIILLNGAVSTQIYKVLPFPEPQADWNETDINSPNYIINKPSIFNVGYNSVNASGDITTTSLTDVVATGMTITPTAGTYIVLFSSDMKNSSNNRTMNYSIYVNGVQVANSQRINSVNNNIDRNVAHTSSVVTVNGSEAIDIRWRTSGNTATMGNRILTLLKVS